MPLMAKSAENSRWSIIREAEKPPGRSEKYYWCRCVCGTERRVRGPELSSGRSLSCGCLTRETNASLNLVHGGYGTREYRSWLGMKRRCYDRRHANFHIWGGRGICVCERWLHSFGNFLADMGPCPKGMTIDRVDTNGHYEPDNCRWATITEQARNRRTNIHLTLGGTSKTIAAWAEDLKIRPETIYWRHKRGLPDAECLRRPRRYRFQKNGDH